MPSCVAIYEDKFMVGEQARKSLQMQDNTVARFKRDMGTSKMYNIKGKSISNRFKCISFNELKYAQKKLKYFWRSVTFCFQKKQEKDYDCSKSWS